MNYILHACQIPTKQHGPLYNILSFSVKNKKQKHLYILCHCILFYIKDLLDYLLKTLSSDLSFFFSAFLKQCYLLTCPDFLNGDLWVVGCQRSL